MEKVGQVEQKKGKAGKKAKPIKVVYISNPMRITTCPSKFRAVVQELTGQDADPDRAVAGNYVNVGGDVATTPPVVAVDSQDRGGQPWPASTSVPLQVSDVGAAHAHPQLLEDVLDYDPLTMDGFDFPTPDLFHYNHHPDG